MINEEKKTDRINPGMALSMASGRLDQKEMAARIMGHTAVAKNKPISIRPQPRLAVFQF